MTQFVTHRDGTVTSVEEHKMNVASRDGVGTEEKLGGSENSDINRVRNRLKNKEMLNPQALKEGTEANKGRQEALKKAEERKAETAMLQAKLEAEFSDNR